MSFLAAAGQFCHHPAGAAHRYYRSQAGQHGVFAALSGPCHPVPQKLGAKRWALLGGILLAFGTGVLSLVFAELPLVLALHKAVSITCVFFLAIHIFVFAYRRLGKEN